MLHWQAVQSPIAQLLYKTSNHVKWVQLLQVHQMSVRRSHCSAAGAVFAASNAALMLAELEEAPSAAVLEMQKVARRAPGSADMRAALAALYWAQARQNLRGCIQGFRVRPAP